MQAPGAKMQKTWSTDSIHESFAASTSASTRAPSVDIDRPRKHASRSALFSGNGARSALHHGRSNGTGMLATGDEQKTTASSGADAHQASSREQGALHRQTRHRHSESHRNGSTERSRIRDSMAHRKTRRRGKARADSTPASLSEHSMKQSGKYRHRLAAGDDVSDNENAIEEDEGEDIMSSPQRKRYQQPSLTRLESIESRNESAGESTYAGGPSGYDDELHLDEASTSDASSTDRQHFDWDTPHRRVTGAMSGLQPLTARADSQRLSRNGDETGLLGVYNRRSAGALTHDGPNAHGTGVTTPTRRRFHNSSPASEEMHSDVRNEQGKVMGAANGSRPHDGKTGTRSVGIFSRAHLATRMKMAQFVCNSTAESLLLLSGCALMIAQLKEMPAELHAHAHELTVVVIVSSIYYFGLRTPSERGTIWATDHRNYRQSGDDGAMPALLLGPLLATACLFSALQSPKTLRRPATGDSLPFPPWRVDPAVPILGESRQVPHARFTALVLSRCSLVSMQTLMTIVLIVHLLSTKWIRRPDQLSSSNWHKLWSYTKFSVAVTLGMGILHEALVALDVPLWKSLSRSEVLLATHFFQGNLYAISRLARKSFTLGELTVVATVGMVLTMETINVTAAKLTPASTSYIKSFRRPTPLLIFQLALVVGTFMIGFMLSPLLYLSRHLAQKPLHRLRWPHKRDLHRRLLAFFFYLFATLFIVGVLGLWVWWLLGRRNPWMWTFQFVISGASWWSRPLLVTYWIALVSASVAGWQATVIAGKRFRWRTNRKVGSSNAMTGQSASANAGSAALSGQGASGESDVNINARMRSAAAPQQMGLSNSISSGNLFAKRSTYLSLNARRKFFHALAVLLFAPGIAYDPAFMHLAFSLAFSVFIFAEYVRYYALFPFGAPLHVFLSEFTDHKDSGPVILSHFYLLTGCAGTLWVDGLGQSATALDTRQHSNAWIAPFSSFLNATTSKGPSSSDLSTATLGHVDLSMFIGVLTLGIADAVASIIGRRYGRLYWPASGKTLEGTIAFVVSLICGGAMLKVIGWCAPFSLLRFTYVAIVLGIFEGISNQNDNLVLPLYGIIALSIFGV